MNERELPDSKVVARWRSRPFVLLGVSFRFAAYFTVSPSSSKTQYSITVLQFLRNKIILAAGVMSVRGLCWERRYAGEYTLVLGTDSNI